MSWNELLVQVVLAGFSAFGGAFAAFYLERRRDGKKETDEKYLAARYAHFVVLTQYQEILTLERGHLAEFKENQYAWRLLQPAIAGFLASTLNSMELSFLLEAPDPDLLNRLTLGQQRYETVRKILALRADAHGALQARTAQLHLNGVEAVSDEDSARLVGLDVVGALKSLTLALYQCQPAAKLLLERNLEDLTAFIKATFPDRRAPRYVLSPDGASRGTSD